MFGLKRHPLIVFFALAFALPWLVWGTAIGQAYGWFSFRVPQALAFWLGLTIATWLAAALTGGRAAIIDLARRIVRWQAHPIWYIIALVLTAILGFIAIAIHQLFGGPIPDFNDVSLGSIGAGLAFQIFFFTLTEEPAWRGFALPRLQARYNALVSSLILGTLWGLWHIPLFLIPGSFQATLPFVGFMLSAIATAILFTWLFNQTNGSVLLAGILHAATDLTIAQMGVMQNSAQLFWIFVAVQWLAALGVIGWQGATHLARNRVTLNLHAATK